jgi:membrane-bound lytic murein transglycosylase A
VGDWQKICNVLASSPPTDATQFFETWFRPYSVAGNAGDNGLFTGYFEVPLHGSRYQSAKFHTPLYSLPDDYLTADLGLFKKDLAGQKIIGKVSGKNFFPYDARDEIVAGSLVGRAKVIAWVDNETEAFFLSVQGSGQVVMENGDIVHVGYAGTNGKSYVAIGRVLADDGKIARPVTMEKIRAYLAAHPADAEIVMNRNPSYIFFREIPGAGPLGALGVPLTPSRSLAVDPAYVPLGVPLWLDTTDGFNAPLRRLMVAQDTGGAIKGVVRGDVFWGLGDVAEQQAGAMQNRGRYFMLLPKSVSVDER